MSASEPKDDWMTVPQMVADLGGNVSDDKVRQWCRAGKIEGVIDKGDGTRSFFVAPKAAWEKFKQQRQAQVVPLQRASSSRQKYRFRYVASASR